MLNIVVLLSGKGSNLAAIIGAIENKQLDAKILGVFSDKVHAGGLEIAKTHQIATFFIDPAKYQAKEQYNLALLTQVQNLNPDMVVLAGFMRILGDDFVKALKGKLINIHPSLLPKYKGLNTHKRALENKEKEHGCTVHFVNQELDSGAIIAQMACTLSPDENEQTLKDKVHELEHQLYPRVLQWFAKGFVKLEQDTLFISEELLAEKTTNIRIPS